MKEGARVKHKNVDNGILNNRILHTTHSLNTCHMNCLNITPSKKVRSSLNRGILEAGDLRNGDLPI